MRVLRVYSHPLAPSKGGILLLVGFMLFCFGLSGQKVSLFQLRNAPDSSYVIGAGPGGVAKWVKKDSLLLIDSIYINGEWVYSGDTVDITDTYVQFFDGGSFQNVTFTTGETIVFSGPAPGGVYLDNLGGGYYGILVNEVDGDIDNEKGSARMSGDSIFYKKCPYCVDSLIGVIIHPTYEPDPRIYRTGTIDFISPGWWGTAGIPLSGNLTIDNTNARDITQYVYHSASTPPLFSPASFSAVGTYVPDEVNVIKIEYVSNSEYHVSINR